MAESYPSKTLGDWFVPSEIDELILGMKPGYGIAVVEEKGVYLTENIYLTPPRFIPILELVFPEPEPEPQPKKKRTRRGRRRRKR